MTDHKPLLELCKSMGVRRVRDGEFEAEFFPPTPEPMPLDPVSLSKTLADSMPPDSAMLFAATEDPAPENPTPKPLESPDMA